jgi:hypothetical protein
MRAILIVLAIAFGNLAAATAGQTYYTLPTDIHWVPDTTRGVPPGSFLAMLRGAYNDKCGELLRMKFPNGFVYPWHVNNVYGIYTVLQGTLVLGFDEHHQPSRERHFPAGSVIQGLVTELHYGRAIGETIFDVYIPCGTQ